MMDGGISRLQYDTVRRRIKTTTMTGFGGGQALGYQKLSRNRIAKFITESPFSNTASDSSVESASVLMNTMRRMNHNDGDTVTRMLCPRSSDNSCITVNLDSSGQTED